MVDRPVGLFRTRGTNNALAEIFFRARHRGPQIRGLNYPTPRIIAGVYGLGIGAGRNPGCLASEEVPF
jgi:hypothetical protein